MVNNNNWQKIFGKIKFYILGLVLAIFLVFFAFNKHTDISAATFGWIQTSWSGGASTTITAMHPGNKTGWSFFDSKSSNLDISNDEMKLQMNSQTARVQTLDADFSAGSRTNSYISGGKVIMQKPVNATCSADIDCATNYCEPQATSCQVPPVECDGSNGEFICGNICVYKGDVYSTVSIGTQCWFANNVRTTVYPDGTAITKGNPVNGGGFGSASTANYSCPPNDINGNTSGEDCAAAGGTIKLGMLYQRKAAMNGAASATGNTGPRGICPANWHIPADNLSATSDFGKLFAAVSAISGCSGNEATCLRVGGASGFNLPWAGYRMADGWYFSRASGARLWTASDDQPGWPRFDKFEGSTVSRTNNSSDMGNSVRCVHD